MCVEALFCQIRSHLDLNKHLYRSILSTYISAPDLWRYYCFSLVSSPNRDLCVFNMLALFDSCFFTFFSYLYSHVLIFKVIFTLVYLLIYKSIYG